VFLWYADPAILQARAHALDEGPQYVARELWVVVNNQHVRETIAGAEAHVPNDVRRVPGRCTCARGDSVHLARQQVDVVLNHVEPSHCRRQASNPVNPNHPAPPRWQWQGVKETAWAAMLRLHPLARLARAYVLGDIEILPHPKGQAAHQRPRLGAPKVPPEWPIVTLAEHLRSQPTPGGYAKPVRSALAPAVQQAASHQERPARWSP